MQYLIIPESGVKISRIGLGCARLQAGSEISTSLKIIQSALDCGITHFDTSPFYGSELLLGNVLSGQKNVTITSKFGLTAQENPHFRSKANFFYRKYFKSIFSKFPLIKSRVMFYYSGIKSSKGYYDNGVKVRLSKDFILRELDQSLLSLKRDYIDLYLVHEPERFEITDELICLLESLKSDGIVRSIGYAFNNSPFDYGKNSMVVEQCRFYSDSPNKNPNKIRIYHGVLRHSLYSNDNFHKANPNKLIQSVLDKESNSTVIFSASSALAVKKVVLG